MLGHLKKLFWVSVLFYSLPIKRDLRLFALKCAWLVNMVMFCRKLPLRWLVNSAYLASIKNLASYSLAIKNEKIMPNCWLAEIWKEDEDFDIEIGSISRKVKIFWRNKRFGHVQKRRSSLSFENLLSSWRNWRKIYCKIKSDNAAQYGLKLLCIWEKRLPSGPYPRFCLGGGGGYKIKLKTLQKFVYVHFVMFLQVGQTPYHPLPSCALGCHSVEIPMA